MSTTESSSSVGSPLAVPVLTAGVAVVGAQAFVVAPLLPDVAASLAVDVPAVGQAVAAYGVALAATALTAGAVLDRLRLSRALVVALLALAASLALVAVAPSVGALALGQAGSGAAAGVVLPATYALAGRVAPPGQVARVTGRVLVGWSLAMALGVPLAALLGDLAGWRVVFLVLALVALGQALTAARWLGRLDTGGPVGSPESRPRYLDAVRAPGVRGLLLAVAGYMAAFYAVYAYLGDEVRGVQEVGALGASIHVLAYGVGFGAATLLDGTIDRLGARRVLAPALLVLAGLYGLVAVSTWSVAVLAVVSLAWGLVNHVGLTVLVSLLGQAAPTQRGAVMSLYSATTYAAGGLATAAGGWLLVAGGYAVLALSASAVVALAAVVALRTDPGRRAGRAPATPAPTAR